jgi:ribosome maturation factor RimP
LHSIIKTVIFAQLRERETQRKREQKFPLFIFEESLKFCFQKIELVIEKNIEQLLLTKFEEEEYSDCYIIEILQNNMKLQIFLDSDSDMNFTKCRKISRYLEEQIDEHQWMGEKYTLEVSSPGDRPLKFPRQYKKNIGRTIEVLTNEDEKVNGEMIEVNEEGIVVEYKVRIKEGKKKRTEMMQTPVAFDNIKKAKIKFSFSK